MLAKLQHVDSFCLHSLSSAKTSTSPGNGVSASPVDNTVRFPRSSRELKHAEGSDVDSNRFGRVDRHISKDEKAGGAVAIESAARKQRFHETSDEERRKNTIVSGGTAVRKDLGVTLKAGNRNGCVEKVQPKCSKKWLCYGGCIPAILQALDEVKDLDEAFRPWSEGLNAKEKSIILKEQTSWERALEIFRWFQRKGCYRLNVIHFNIMFKILGKARKWSLVETLWRELNAKGISPINSTYGTLIDVYSKGGLKEEALVWLERMNKQGIEADEVTMGIVVQLYKKAGEFRKAESFFKNWSLGKSLNHDNNNESADSSVRGSSLNAHLSLSSHTYNTLIDTYGKAGQLLEASETFKKMLKEGVAPTTVTFNTMIHICGNRGRLEEVTSLMQKMEELRCPPDTRTYNILISLHAKHNDIDMATNYFRKMKEAQLQPDNVSCRTLLYAYSIRHMVLEAEKIILEMDELGIEIDEFTQSAVTRMYIEAGRLKESMLWFERFHLAGNMTSECYAANIDAYGERGYCLEAEKVFFSCREAKKLTVLEFNVMIKAYGVVKDHDKACKLFDSMDRSDVVPDKCSFSTLIQILVNSELPFMANCYLKKMQSLGLVNDCIPHSVVISSYTKLGHLKMAESLYKEMIDFGIKPDIVVYGVLINAFADSGSVQEALQYIDDMKKSGFEENVIIYNSLIKLYTRVGYFKEAEETYKLLRSSQDGPTIYSSNCMIDLYSERSMVKEAKEIFGSVKSKGEANEFTFAMMLCMYKKLGRIEEAIKIAREMMELKLLTELLSFNNVLGLYVMDGRFKEAVKILEMMMKACIEPDDCTFKSLGIILSKCGISKQAISKLEVMAKRDLQTGLQAWRSVVYSVVGVNGYDDV